MRWWARLASRFRSVSAGLVALAACHAAPPASPGAPPGSGAEASCKVSEPVCDPAVSDDTALALVRRRCAGCHAEGGKAEHPLLDADALFPARGDVALRLSGCEMPPDSTPLPAADRRRLIGWGACAAATPAK